MYGVLPVIVTIFTLALVSSTTLWAANNNSGIKSVQARSDKMHRQMVQNNELTKNQIIQLINKVNENDVKILSQHKDIKNEVKQTVKDTKTMNENLDARFRGFKNITNANVVGLTDRVKTNHNLVNRRVDDITTNLSDYRIKNDIEINELRFNHSNLSDMHSQLNSDFNTFRSETTSGLQSNVDYAADLNKQTVDFIDTKFNSFVSDSVQMDDKAAAVLNNIRDITNKKMVGIESDYKRQDKNIRATISNMENMFKTDFLKTDQLENTLNKTYFDDKPEYNNMNSLIASTSQNKNKIKANEKRIDANDLKISSITNDYLKKSDIPQQINKAMPSTDIYRDVKNQDDEIQRLSKRVSTNVETIDASNKELKEMLKGVTGGLDGDITLNDLHERIMKNSENINANAAKTKVEILEQIKAKNADINKKIDDNKIALESKVANDKEPYNKSFNELIDPANVSSKLKGSDIDINAISAENVTIDKDLMVQGVKFSSLMNDLRKNGLTSHSGPKPVTVPIYSRDFKSDDKISPLKSVSFQPDTNLDMKDGKFSMKRGQFDLQNTIMNANDTDINWKKYENNVNLNGNGVNFNNTKVKVNTFDNLKNSRDETLSRFIDNKIEASQSSSEGGLAQKVRKAVKENPAGLEAKSIMTPFLYVGNPFDKINVKTEIESIKQSITNYRAESGARQNAMFYMKNKPEDVQQTIRKDMVNNYPKYMPDDAKFKQISSDNLNVEKINLKADSMNNIKFNGTPLAEALDKRYELQGAVKNALDSSNLRKSLSNVEVDPDTNELILTYSDTTIPPARVKLPDIPVSVQNVTIEGNDVVLHYNNGITKNVPLPEIDFTPYAVKTEVDEVYAKKNEEGAKVVHLNDEDRSRLDAIVSDDKIKSLKEFDTERVTTNENEMKVTTGRVAKIEDRSKSWDMIETRIKPQISLQTVNNHTKNNKSDNFIRLNDDVALRAQGNRLQMCRSLQGNSPSDPGYEADKNCVDIWTTLDIKPDDNIKIQD